MFFNLLFSHSLYSHSISSISLFHTNFPPSSNRLFFRQISPFLTSFLVSFIECLSTSLYTVKRPINVFNPFSILRTWYDTTSSCFFDQNFSPTSYVLVWAPLRVRVRLISPDMTKPGACSLYFLKINVKDLCIFF